MISIIGIPSYSWDTSFKVTAKIYSNAFVNLESTVLNGVLSFLNIHDLTIFNNTLVNCKAYRDGGEGFGQSINSDYVNICTKCTTENCIDCSSEDVCSRCNEKGATPYYLDVNSNCVECADPGKLILRTAGTQKICVNCLETNCETFHPTNENICIKWAGSKFLSYSLRNSEQVNV